MASSPPGVRRGSASVHVSGIEGALKVVRNIIGPSAELYQSDLEALCKLSIVASKNTSVLAKHEAMKSNMKHPEKKMMELISSGINVMSEVQTKNHSMRFGSEEGDKGLLQRPFSVFTGARNSFLNVVGGGINTTSPLDSHDYEDIVSEAILKAPITELCVIQRGEPVPPGFLRISKTPGNKKANLNASSGGNHLYFCIKKDASKEAVPITALVLIFPDRSEFVPPGYFVARHDKFACNLNSGTSAERIFLCYKKDKSGNPITDLVVIFPGKSEEPPKSFNLIEKSPTDLPANVNTGTVGGRIFVCYKQHLVRLECLRNDVNIVPSISGNKSGGMSPIPVKNNGKATGGTGTGSTGSGLSTGLSVGSATVTNGLPPSRTLSASSPEILPKKQFISSSLKSTVSSGVSSGMSQDELAAVALGDFSDDETDVQEVTPIVATSSSAVKGKEEEENEDIDTCACSPEDPTCLSQEELLLLSIADRRTQAVVNPSGKVLPVIVRKTMHALLSALYVRQSNLSQMVMAEVTALLKDTDFFEDDLKALPLAGTITILDLTIEAVCDRVDSFLEHEHQTILQFFRVLVKHSSGRLSVHSQQKLFRCLSFLYSSYSSKSSWMASGLPHPCAEGGGDLLALKVFKELTWATVAQVETVDIAYSLPDAVPDTFDYTNTSEAFELARSFVIDFIEDVIDSLEVSRISEAAHMTIAKPSSSTTSALFWVQIGTISTKMFTENALRSAFLALCAICKLAWHGLRPAADGSAGGAGSNQASARDLGCKLLALETLLEFCASAGEKMRLSKVMGYQIRRLVVPCLLANLQYAILDHRVFSKVLRIISVLWKVWRVHVRIEFANLVEKLIIRVLQASTLKIRPAFQMTVLQEVVTWFDQPQLLVEMFVNFDMDRKFVSHWNVFSHLVRAVCATARKCSMVTGAWDWRPTAISPGLMIDGTGANVTIREVHMKALEECGRIAKTLMDATGHAHLIMRDADFRTRSLGVGAGWEEDDDNNNYTYESRSDSPDPDTEKMTPRGEGESRDGRERNSSESPSENSMSLTVDMATNTTSNPPTPLHKGNKRRSTQGVKFRRAVHQEAEDHLRQAIKIFAETGSLKKSIKYLVNKNFMADSPQEIASFLRVYKNSFDPSAIGEYLGEGGVTPHEEVYWAQIRFRYTRAISFVELEVEPALRLYLTGCGFRLPGEAQKIDRFVEVFVKAFWQDNQGTVYCPFHHPDTVHLLSYAAILLNTDLHRANTDNKKRSKKMTKEEFCNNLKGADQGHNINKDYIGRIYDNVRAMPIELAVESSEAGGKIDRDDKEGAPDLNATEEKIFANDITRRLRDSEDLLRSLSPFTYRFQITGVDINISLDLVSFMYETVWFHFHAISEALLSTLNSDIYVTFAAVDILCYSLNSSIFLNLRTEKAAFAGQLYKFQKMCLDADSSLICKLSDESWFQRVTDATPETAMECIADIHHLSVLLKDGIQESANYEVTRSVAARIEKKARVLELNTFFVREGDLSKKSRTGRLVAYKFFLFSDHLIYSHQSIMGIGAEFRVHEQLALAPMTISDIDDPTGCSFFIAHPTKSFVIIAESREVKTLWLRDTFQTIVSCRKREALRQNGLRKMSIIDRIEGQQKSGLVSQASRERERESAPFAVKTHPHPIPCLNIPRPPSFSSFSPASSKILLATESSNNFFPDGQSAFQQRSRSLPMDTLREEGGAGGGGVGGGGGGGGEDGGMRGRAPSLKKSLSLGLGLGLDMTDDETDNPSDVFTTIMQMATLHMDEVELLTVTSGISPESSSGLNTPERRRSSGDNLSSLSDAITQIDIDKIEKLAHQDNKDNKDKTNNKECHDDRNKEKSNGQKEGQKDGIKDNKGNKEKGKGNNNKGNKEKDDLDDDIEAKKRNAARRDNMNVFVKRVADLPEKSLRDLFNAGATFWRGMAESRGGGGVPEETKTRMHGLFAQARNGPADRDVAPSSSSSSSGGVLYANSAARIGLPPPSVEGGAVSPGKTSQIGRSKSNEQGHMEAWRDCGSMSQDQAMRTYLEILLSFAPYWKYEQFI